MTIIVRVYHGERMAARGMVDLTAAGWPAVYRWLTEHCPNGRGLFVRFVRVIGVDR